MATVSPPSTDERLRLDNGWRMMIAPAGSLTDPVQACGAGIWIDAVVPGTAAGALREAGHWSFDEPQSLHDRDVWYRIALTQRGRKVLRFEGLATLATIWLDGTRVGETDNMFRTYELPCELSGKSELVIRFRSLTRHLETLSGPRARWRAGMIPEQKLRLVRTTLLGHMPGWCPPVDCIGPWRPVTMREADADVARDLSISTAWHAGTGVLDVSFARAGGGDAAPRIVCAGREAAFVADGARWRARLDLPGIAPWTVHTHGTPALHETAIVRGGTTLWSGRSGFRSIDVDRGPDGDGFGLLVNDVPVFARGACWTPADPVSLPCDEASYRRELTAMHDAGFNMVRIGGTMVYEAGAFFRVADELGILVWQDLMLANFDYPLADAEFRAGLKAEIADFLASTAGHCSLAVVCGGSEALQQAAMLGLPRERWNSAFYEDELPGIVAEHRGDVIAIANSPHGGELPFVVDRGVGHYYGVGAYMRPLEDARRANVRFASECLAFANVPDPVTLANDLSCPAVHHPKWKQRVPRDQGASWDFEDVREHYMALLYGIAPAQLRYENPQRYLAFARAAAAETMEATIAEWRRPGSSARGALVFLWKDLWPGAGWGLTDAGGEPKSVWHAMRRACAPLSLILCDEGVNGLDLHVVNDTDAGRECTLEVACYRDGATKVQSGTAEVAVAAHGAWSAPATQLFGGFFDTTYAYRFGPAAHDVTCARLVAKDDGSVLAEAFHFPLGRGANLCDTGLSATLVEDAGGYALDLSCTRMAQSVMIDDRSWRPLDNHFHLAPGATRRVRLVPRHDTKERPAGEASALNGLSASRY